MKTENTTIRLRQIEIKNWKKKKMNKTKAIETMNRIQMPDVDFHIFKFSFESWIVFSIEIIMIHWMGWMHFPIFRSMENGIQSKNYFKKNFMVDCCQYNDKGDIASYLLYIFEL